MKQEIKNIKENQITFNSSSKGHIYNINIEINEKTKPSTLKSLYAKSISMINRIKKIITWLGTF